MLPIDYDQAAIQIDKHISLINLCIRNYVFVKIDEKLKIYKERKHARVIFS